MCDLNMLRLYEALSRPAALNRPHGTLRLQQRYTLGGWVVPNMPNMPSSLAAVLSSA